MDAQKTENGAIISADFTKKASPIRLKPEQEIILRERLSNYIQGTQIAAIIAKKDAYKKARHGMTSNSMTDIIASLNALMRTTELREQSLRAGTPVIAFYNGKIKEATSQKERIERKLSGAYSPDKRMELLIEQEINNFTLELLSREFAYAKSSVQGILSGNIGEKTPVMISRNTVSRMNSAMNSTLKKAA